MDLEGIMKKVRPRKENTTSFHLHMEPKEQNIQTNRNMIINTENKLRVVRKEGH